MGTIVINAPNSVLGYPWNAKTLRTGVTDGATHSVSVTGWIVGYGNESASTLTLPGIVTSLTTLYRQDWQGKVALSASARTNYWLQNATFSSPNSTNALTSITGGYSAPDGTSNAYKILENTTNDAHLLYQSITYTAAAWTVTFYTKAAERTWAWAQIKSGSGAYVNLSNGALGTVSGGVTASTRTLKDGWIRITLTMTMSAGAANAGIGSATGDGGKTFAGSATSGIFVFKPQAEPGSVGTSTITTAAAAVAVTDYSLSGSTLTFAEVPAAKAALSVDAAVSPHPHFYYPFNYR